MTLSADSVPVCRIRQDATASLILLWKVTATGFRQCSLIDGRSVTLLQAPGGLVLLEEMLALGQNHFIGELWVFYSALHLAQPNLGLVFRNRMEGVLPGFAYNRNKVTLAQSGRSVGSGFLRQNPSPGQRVTGAVSLALQAPNLSLISSSLPCFFPRMAGTSRH